MSEITLKPCPFCGSEKLKVKSSGRWGYFVACECHAVGPNFSSREGAIDAWNTRLEPRQGRLDI